MTPEQHQQLVTLITELVENRRESLQLQREAFRSQQEAIAMQREAIAVQRETVPSVNRMVKRAGVMNGVALTFMLIALAIGLFLVIREILN